jgi:CRP/FNR family transcriptional regulator, anaerobic regulatory protein
MNTVIPITNANANAAAAKPGKVNCGLCSFNRFCLPQGLADTDMSRLDQIIARRRRVGRDEQLFSMGASFGSLYAVRLGHFKTAQVNIHGEQQVTGFHMAGDLLGMDAIGSGLHNCSATALEDSEVCEIPFGRLQDLAMQTPALMQQFHRVLGREIQREQAIMLFRGSMRADQRMALLLLNLGARYAARGYSASTYQLRMSREDIGGYLGLTIESVSRLLARFRKQGGIKLDNRDIRIIDRDSLEALSTGREPGAGDEAASETCAA